MSPKLVVYGVGFVGQELVRLATRKGWEIVAALNRSGDKVGQDVGRLADSSWDIQIEGRPTSVKCTVAVQASFRDNLVSYEGDDTSPLYYAKAVPVIQAIPVICGHQPGIVYPSVFASCAPDLRLLETRKSLVG